MAIPNVEDYRKLVWKIQALFEIPKARCETLKITNDYSAPPAPKCIGEEAVPASPGLKVALSGLPSAATPQDLGLHSSSTALGEKGQSAQSQQTMLIGKMCQRIKRGYGT